MSSLPPKSPKLLEPLNSYNSGISDTTVIEDADETGRLVAGESTEEGSASSSVGGLPKGAAKPRPPTLLYNSATSPPVSPPATPSQKLLDGGGHNHVQFAAYPQGAVAQTWDRPIGDGDEKRPPVRSARGDKVKPWLPLPLRGIFVWSLVFFLVALAIALEVLLNQSNKHQGWATSGDIEDKKDAMHYVYTIPPTAVAAFLAAMWAWTDVEIKKMQPYIDLAQGDSPAQRSLLLDYTRHNNFTVWFHAWTNRHYLVFLTSAMVLLSLAFQPLAAALLVVRDTYWTKPDMSLSTLRTLGLNQNEEFSNLTSFVTAAGYASASVLYNLGEPPFIHQPYTVAPFEIPRNVVANGTLFANTTALKSDSGCRPIQINMQQLADGSGWNNSVNSNGCRFQWSVDRNATTLFGTDTPICDNAPPQQFAPVIFWFFTYRPSAMASGTICTPSFSLFNVAVTVDIATGNLTDVRELGPFSSSSNFSSLSGNITGPPLNGRAYNGLKFDLGPTPDRFTLAKESATQLQLPAAVYQAAVQSPEGLVGSFTADRFVDRSTQVYTTYLQLIARQVYFLPNREPINVRVKTVVKRVYLSPVAVHLLAVAMFVLALCAAALHWKHRQERRHLRLGYEPGTIASAVAIGAETGVGQLLKGAKRESDMKAALASRSFRLDRVRGVIVMEGEPGYEFAESADLDDDRRRSLFAKLQSEEGLGRRLSRRISSLAPSQLDRWKSTRSEPEAMSPKSPRSPGPEVAVSTPRSPKQPV